VPEPSSSLRILVTGASGLIGSALIPALETRSHRIVKLVRTAVSSPSDAATWNPDAGQITLDKAGNIDAVVHLAGEPIAKRWSVEVKRRIRDSRVKGTRLLSEALARLPKPPKVLVCASATGLYGDRGEEWLDETSRPGLGFLAETCREWESAAAAAREAGIRVVHLRLGLVLTPKGGALAKMLPAFRLGLGGRLGDGRAFWSWIALDDLLEVIQRSLADESLRGPVNTVSPNPVTNAEFTATLGRVLRRPAILPVPRFVIEVVFGEMGREALMSSFRVKPVMLLEAGFRFRFLELEPALRHLLEGAAE
jgi:uncharacterized protein (TIGR01777 family)